MIASTFAAIIVLPIVGFICDRIESRKIIIVAYLLRTFTVFMFNELKQPDTWQAYLVCVSIVITSIIEQIANDSIFYKNLPAETRGVFNGLYSFVG